LVINIESIHDARSEKHQVAVSVYIMRKTVLYHVGLLLRRSREGMWDCRDKTCACRII